jgi:hypothetical protein
MGWVERAASLPPDLAARVQTNPSVFKTFAMETLKSLRAQGGRSAYDSGGVKSISATQQRIKTPLRAEAVRVVAEQGLPADKVITHGTSLQGLLGMLMTGEIRSTSRQGGISGEKSEVWGGYGVDVGASYGATTGTSQGQPGVEIIMYNPTLRVVRGDALNRAPKVDGDFVAVIVTDGTRTFVLDKTQLKALAGSAEAWKKTSIQKAHAGQMGEFQQWETLQDQIVPQ